MKRARLALWVPLMVVSLLQTPGEKVFVATAVPGYSENQVKAAFITHLFSFIDWPTESAHYVLCATKASPLVDTLVALVEAKPALGLSVELLAHDDVNKASCHALILEAEAYDSEDSRRKSESHDAHEGLLTISDAPGFARQGGMIELERRPSRIGLVVNLPAARKAGFQVSSKLLRLATIVDGEGA